MNQFEARRAKKEKLVLDFLKDEGFSTTGNLGDLMGVKRSAALSALKSFEKHELLQQIKTDDLVVSRGNPILWGLTPTGAFLATNEGAWRYFEPSHASEYTMKHELEVQRARIKAHHLGWQGWLGGRTLRKLAHDKRSKWLRVPDGYGVSPKGRKVAIEVERTVKTYKRYPLIINDYCQMLLDGTIQEIVYICPNNIAPRLGNYCLSIEKIIVGGAVHTFDGSFKKRFHFVSSEEWGDYAKNF